MRFFNNTDIESHQEAYDSIKHFLLAVPTHLMESIELNEEKLTVFGEDCILLEQPVNKSLPVKGEIRWFDESSGDKVECLISSDPYLLQNCGLTSVRKAA